VPVPWTADPPAFGFTSGTPWLPPPAEFGARSVAAQEGDSESTLELFRAAIARRPAGKFAWRASPEGTISFTRGEVVCLVNVAAGPVQLPGGDVVIRSDTGEGALTAGSAAWVTLHAAQS
jgi:alpha-glucosidase